MKRWILFGSLLLSSFLNADPLDHASISYYAVNVRTGEVVAERNSNLSLIPGSSLKVVTTGAALHQLGPDYRFETQLEYDGSLDAAQTVHGNLYIRGGGDPCLGSDRVAGSLSWKQQIGAWADAIQQAGIQKIEGKVIGDATLWETALAAPGWMWEDLANYYGAGACALSFHENSYKLFFKPANQVGEPADIYRTDPENVPIHFRNEVKTGPQGSGDCACIYGSEYNSEQFVRGTIPAGVPEFAIKGSLPNPAAYCAELLSLELHKRGVGIEQKALPFSKERKVIFTTRSPPLKEIVYWTNQKSINLYAEHFLKAMGSGSTVKGTEAVHAFWKGQQIDLSGFNMVDGSGLSRKNLITAQQLVGMLLKLHSSEHFPHFFASLPEEGRVHAKTGSMNLFRAYAGYTGDIAFAILINNCLQGSLVKAKIRDFVSSLNP